jgi:putative transposase
MLRAHKIRLYPNNVQATYFAKACGVARFAYNWALAEWRRRYETGEKVNEGILRRELNSIKREQFPWMLEVTKCAPQLAIKNDLNSAFRNFFRNVKQGNKDAGYPKFHKKGVKDSFALSNDQFQINEKSVKIPHLGWVRMAESLRFDGKVLSATVSRTADKWYIAVQVELSDIEAATRTGEAIGVDLGVKALATLSDGTQVVGSKASRKYEAKLKRLNQSLSRKIGAKKGEKKSENFVKTKRRISRLYAKMANLRGDETHKLTTMLVRNYSLIGIEDLNVRGMMANHKLARSIADMSFFEFRRQLEYKAKVAGANVIVADMWFPSSKTCSKCGIVKDELKLSERRYVCECGTELDRDVNAAINLKNYALQRVT